MASQEAWLELLATMNAMYDDIMADRTRCEEVTRVKGRIFLGTEGGDS